MERLRELRGPDTRERDLANILGFEHSRAVRWKEGQMYVDRAEYLVRLADALDVEPMLLVTMASGGLTVEQAHRQVNSGRSEEPKRRKGRRDAAEPLEMATDASSFGLEGGRFESGSRGLVLLVSTAGEGRAELGAAVARHAEVSGLVATGLSIGLILAERYRPEIVFLDLGAGERPRVRGLSQLLQPHRAQWPAGAGHRGDVEPHGRHRKAGPHGRRRQRGAVPVRAGGVRVRARSPRGPTRSPQGAEPPLTSSLYARDTVPRMDGGLRRHAAWLLVTLAYLAASPYYEHLNNPNENVRVWATRAIVEHHVLNVDEVSREWGYVNDKAKNAWHVYSGKAPGATFLGTPVLWVHTKLRALMGWAPPGKRQATFWLRLVAVKLPLAVFFFFFARYVERATRSPLARDLLVVALGLGTLMYPYGNLFVGHALAAAAAFSAFMLLDDTPGAEDGDDLGGDWRLAGGRRSGWRARASWRRRRWSSNIRRCWYRRRWRSTPASATASERRRSWSGPCHRASRWALTTRSSSDGRGGFRSAASRTPSSRGRTRAGFHGLSLPHAAAFPAFSVFARLWAVRLLAGAARGRRRRRALHRPGRQSAAGRAARHRDLRPHVLVSWRE